MSRYGRLILPALVFQGVVIGGGYASGRELVEFFLSYGIAGAALGLVLTAVIWGAVLAIAFDYARLTKGYDYDTFTEGLIGPLRYLLEAAFVALIVLVIAVLAAASNAIFEARLPQLNVPVGSLIFMALACLSLLLSDARLAKLMSFWSILLYAAFGVLLILTFLSLSGDIGAAFKAADIKPGWAIGGASYAAYNLAAIPSTLFAIQYLQTRSEARLAGGIAGIAAIIPAFIYLIILAPYYPQVLDEPVPLTLVLSEVANGPFGLVFDLVILGTFVQTAAASLHALNNRIASARQRAGKTLSISLRPVIGFAVIAFSLSIGLQFGIIAIIATGYGLLTFAFIFLLVIPIVTIGLWRCLSANQTQIGIGKRQNPRSGV